MSAFESTEQQVHGTVLAHGVRHGTAGRAAVHVAGSQHVLALKLQNLIWDASHNVFKQCQQCGLQSQATTMLFGPIQ